MKAAARENADEDPAADGSKPKKSRAKRAKASSEKTAASSSKKQKHEKPDNPNAQDAAPKEQVADVTPAVAPEGGDVEVVEPTKTKAVKKRGAIPADELSNAWANKEL